MFILKIKILTEDNLVKRREIIEFEVGKMEFGGTSSTIIGKRNVQMKGGITGQKVKASVKKARRCGCHRRRPGISYRERDRNGKRVRLSWYEGAAVCF